MFSSSEQKPSNIFNYLFHFFSLRNFGDNFRFEFPLWEKLNWTIALRKDNHKYHVELTTKWVNMYFMGSMELYLHSFFIIVTSTFDFRHSFLKSKELSSGAILSKKEKNYSTWKLSSSMLQTHQQLLDGRDKSSNYFISNLDFFHMAVSEIWRIRIWQMLPESIFRYCTPV